VGKFNGKVENLTSNFLPPQLRVHSTKELGCYLTTEA